MASKKIIAAMLAATMALAPTTQAMATTTGSDTDSKTGTSEEFTGNSSVKFTGELEGHFDETYPDPVVVLPTSANYKYKIDPERNLQKSNVDGKLKLPDADKDTGMYFQSKEGDNIYKNETDTFNVTNKSMQPIYLDAEISSTAVKKASTSAYEFFYKEGTASPISLKSSWKDDKSDSTKTAIDFTSKKKLDGKKDNFAPTAVKDSDGKVTYAYKLKKNDQLGAWKGLDLQLSGSVVKQDVPDGLEAPTLTITWKYTTTDQGNAYSEDNVTDETAITSGSAETATE